MKKIYSVLTLILCASALLLSSCDRPKAAEENTNPQESDSDKAPQDKPETAKEDAPYELKPGIGISEVEFGMTIDDLKAIGLSVEPHPSGQFGDHVQQVNGDLHVVFDDMGQVNSIEAPLNPKGLKLKDKLLRYDSAEKLTESFENCTSPEAPAEGGKTWSCDYGVLVKAGGIKGKVFVQLLRLNSRRI